MKAKASTAVMDSLADRIRDILAGDPRITEKKMFGGITFLLNGHILVGAKKDGSILASVGKDFNDEALAREGATQMVHSGRTMTGFVWIDASATETDDQLRDWVSFCERAVVLRPPKG